MRAYLRERASPLAVFALVAIVATAVAVLLPSHGIRTAPETALSLLDGRTVTLGELRGRPLLLAFWSPTCAPCVEELPDLIALYRELAPRGLELVAVAMPYDPPLAVQTFVRAHEVPYPVALDVDGRVARAVDGVKVIPTTLLIDPKGQVVYREAGKLDIARARRIMAPFLENGPP
jgi:peroxiredoxin